MTRSPYVEFLHGLCYMSCWVFNVVCYVFFGFLWVCYFSSLFCYYIVFDFIVSSRSFSCLLYHIWVFVVLLIIFFILSIVLRFSSSSIACLWCFFFYFGGVCLVLCFFCSSFPFLHASMKYSCAFFLCAFDRFWYWLLWFVCPYLLHSYGFLQYLGYYLFYFLVFLFSELVGLVCSLYFSIAFFPIYLCYWFSIFLYMFFSWGCWFLHLLSWCCGLWGFRLWF